MKLTILNERDEIVKLYDDDITVEQFDAILEEYKTLLKERNHYRKVTLHNEAMLKIITDNMIQAGFFKGRELNLYPIIKSTTEDIIHEHESKKALRSRLYRWQAYQRKVLWLKLLNATWFKFYGWLKKKFKISAITWDFSQTKLKK